MKFADRNRSLYSLIVTVIISLFIVTQHFSYNQWDNEPNPECFTWDIFGYYLYLPAVFENQDITTLEKTKAFFDEVNPSPHFYQIHNSPTGQPVIMYPVGLSLFYLTPYLGTKTALKVAGIENNSFDKPYHIAISLWSLLFSIITILLLRKLLLHFFSDFVSALTLLCIIVGTNSFYFFASFPLIVHPVLSFYYVSFLLLTITWTKKPTLGISILLGGLYSLAVVTRPSSIFLIILLGFWGVEGNLKSCIDKLKWWLTQFKYVFIMIASAAIMSIPQLVYWKSVTGKWVYFSYTGEWFDFFSPHFYEGLFGWKAGWIYHFPIALIGLIGLVLLIFMKKRIYSIPVLLFSLFHIWLILSWSNYWYGSYMGNRGFTEYQMVLAIPFGFVIQESLKIKWKFVAIITIVSAFALSSIGVIRVLQINQWLWGMQNMSKVYTEANYLKLDHSKGYLLHPAEGDEAFRNNLNDNPESYSNSIIYLNDFEQKLPNQLIDTINNTYLIDSSKGYSEPFYIDGVTGINQQPENGINISLEVLKKIDKDTSEAYLIVEFTNATGKVCYYYNQLPIKLEPTNEWSKTSYFLDLPEKRFDDDKLKLHVFNPNRINFEVDNLSVRLYVK